jgi:hypothetical protein
MATILDSLQLDTGAAVWLKVIVLVLCSAPKLTPLMVTVVSMDPLDKLRLLMCGGCAAQQAGIETPRNKIPANNFPARVP